MTATVVNELLLTMALLSSRRALAIHVLLAGKTARGR
jgi:hypothetical protein